MEQPVCPSQEGRPNNRMNLLVFRYAPYQQVILSVGRQLCKAAVAAVFARYAAI
jgi:hypothetical protein